MGSDVLTRGPDKLQGNQGVSLLLEATNDVTNKATLDTIGLRCQTREDTVRLSKKAYLDSDEGALKAGTGDSVGRD